MIGGIVCGLGAAFSQSCSYLCTRHFVQSRGAGASRDLFILGHLWMGVFAAIGCVWWLPGVGVRAFLAWPIMWPLVVSAVLYLLGQMGLTYALKHAEASRVSPLLGFKVMLQAVLASAVGSPGGIAGEQSITALQWIAVVLCVVGGTALNYSGGRMSRKALWGIVFALVNFAVCDHHIGWLVVGLRTQLELSPGHGAMLGASLQYLVDGLLVLPFVGILRQRSVGTVRDAFPFAVAWFAAMLFLFAAFGAVGVVFGTILQSTRGVMTIVLASAVARLGHEHIEPRHERGVVVRRIGAGALMFIAVTLYVIKEPRNIRLTGGRSGEFRGVPCCLKNSICC